MTQSVLPPALVERASRLVAAARSAGLTIATAESCTGGLIAASVTEIAGSSRVFGRGYVTYANDAKADLLAVPQALLDRVGAVSAEVAEAMAAGALRAAAADVAVSATGIAGPDGGTAEKPVGLVYLGLARQDGQTTVERHVFAGDRAAIRTATVLRALDLLLDAVEAGGV